MSEGLRQVPTQLALCHVVLLGEQPERPAHVSIALEPACCRHVVSLLREGERGDEPAQDEGAPLRRRLRRMTAHHA
jgi:hypothetical protein